MTTQDGAERNHRSEGGDDCLAEGGDIGALMRSIDWSSAPLGPVASWPTSLRTMVAVVLNSRFPMLLWWGPSMLQVYNDAYRPVLGTKHPASLGAAAPGVWAEIWDVIGPMAEGVRRGGAATWSQNLPLYLQSRGFLQETFHTFSYSPVRDEQGGVGGVLVTVQETTEEVQNGRQLRMLRDLAAGSADARSQVEVCERVLKVFATNEADLPFALLYLVDGDARTPERVAHLMGTSGLAMAGSPSAPSRILITTEDDPLAPFPVGDALKGGDLRVTGLRSEVGTVSAGAVHLPVTQAALCPLTRAGAVLGFLVLGVNPCRAIDERYLALFTLTADQVAMSLANARASEQERERSETLTELDRAKTAFFSNVSHEFRTPLTLILGPIEDALGKSPPALDEDALRAVHRNALRLLKLVNTLLDFARIEAGRAEASYRATDLGAFTGEIASAFQSAVERVGLVFEVTCARLGEPHFVDRDMWEKIILNLLSNALKFTFEGAIRVRLAPLASGGAELTVEDTGSGIAEHELPHLFARFRRIEGARSRTHEGSGIGLALVHELVGLHGGDIRVTSTVGVGTRFVVTLPAGSAHLPSERVRTTEGNATRTTDDARKMGAARPFVEEALRWQSTSSRPSRLPGGLPVASSSAPRARIIVADDNADMREYISRLLRDRWAVEAVDDGREALVALRREAADLVITDVMMPNMDGFALLEAIRQDPALKTTPVVMLSARAGDDAHVEGLEAGADDYLVKPFSARELVARVQTHLQVRRLRDAALAERTRLHSILMQAPAPVAVFSGPEHRYEVVNPSFAALVGRDDLLGRTVRVAHSRSTNHAAFEALDRVYRTGETVHLQDLRFMVARGAERLHREEVFFNAIAQPIRDPDDEVTGIVVVALDVTDQVLARRHVDALRASAEQANRAKDEFLAMLGHELRNPLAPIVTALHLMRLRAGGAVERERVVIERQVNHLTRLVDDLLDVSRITRGKVELKRERLEVAEVVAKAIETASPLLEERHHHLRLEVPPNGFLVDGDPTRLSQVVANLLTNAAKYTDRGGHIQVALTKEVGAEGDETLVLTVTDDGIGIAEDVLPNVFETFVQERQSLDRSRGGLGLGLTIVRSLVTMHGGTVSAESAGKGHGSAFAVRLPAASAAAPPHPSSSDPRTSAPQLSSAGGRRILIVDDNEDAAELLAESLVALGHVTHVAHDALEALRVVFDFNPDIALLDIGLPVMDGYELARRLRNEPTLADLRLVAVTGYGQASDRARSREVGFDAHLVKPLDFERLEKVLFGLEAPSARPSRPPP